MSNSGEIHLSVINREVDQILWLPFDRVGEFLTYERDAVVVSGLDRLFTAAA